MTDQVQVRREGDVTVVKMDDGRANAMSMSLAAELTAAIDGAEAAGGALVLLGRDGRFSAGFDLEVMQGGDPAAVDELVGAGARVLRRMVQSPLPVVVGAAGHAVALGALMLLAADERIGPDADAKIGLNEVAIGMTLPGFGIELARERVSKRHLIRVVQGAVLMSPAEAAEIGFLDRLVAPGDVEATAIETAARLAAMPAAAYAGTKRAVRGPLQAALDELAP